jgi:argininosuccinate lyase
MHQYNQSLAYDQRMYAADVKGSIAFSKALQKAGIVSETEQKEIERGLRQVKTEWKEGKVSRDHNGIRNGVVLKPMTDFS